MTSFRRSLRIMAVGTLALALTALTAACGTDSAAKSSANSGKLHKLLPESVKSSGELKFVVQQHPPYTIVNGATATGPSQDLQDALVNELGVKGTTSIIGGGFTPVGAGVLSHRYDIALGPISVTPEHEKQYDMITWTQTKTLYAFEKSSTPTVSDALSLCGSVIAAISGATLEESSHKLGAYCVKQGKPAVKYLPVATDSAVILAIKSGRARAGALTDSQVADATKADSSLTSTPQPTAAGGASYMMGLIVAKDSGLKPAVLAAMKAVFADGTYKEIAQKYNLPSSGLIGAPVANP